MLIDSNFTHSNDPPDGSTVENEISPRNPVSLVDSGRCYIELYEKNWSWRRLAIKELDFSNFPMPIAKRFLLLFDFRSGADGRTWLACSTSGRVCVIKFYNGNWKLNDIEYECHLWNNVWKLSARVVTLCSQTALIMPYVVCLPENQVRDTLIYLNAVLLAIKSLSENSLFHDDLNWKHVGFYKNINHLGSEVTICVFFDLIRIMELNIGVKQIEQLMLQKLGLPHEVSII
jgi:hypothetical protein